MIEDNCLSNLNVYFYLRGDRFGGTPYHRLQSALADADLERLRDVKLMIVEENESFIARTGYVDQLRKHRSEALTIVGQAVPRGHVKNQR